MQRHSHGWKTVETLCVDAKGVLMYKIRMRILLTRSNKSVDSSVASGADTGSLGASRPMIGCVKLPLVMLGSVPFVQNRNEWLRNEKKNIFHSSMGTNVSFGES